jgi:hypothetical protein
VETRKASLGHTTSDITTHYSAAEIRELIEAATKVTDRGIAQTPTLAIIKNSKVIDVGKVSEMEMKSWTGSSANSLI